MLANEFPPLGGGTGIVNQYLLEGMSGYRDLWVDLVTSARGRTYETQPFAERIHLYKVPVRNRNIHHATNRELLTYTWRSLLFCRHLMRRQKYDLSFSFSAVPAGMISLLLRQLTGLPYLVSLQGPDVPGFEARYRYLYPFLTPVLKTIWNRAHIVTATSSGHRRLAQRTMPPLAIDVVHNGVDATAFRPVHKPPTNVFHILCVGRLIERKGQTHLLQSLAALRKRSQDVHLTLVGTGDSEPQLRQQASALGLNGAVTFAGVVPARDMPATYQRADVFALPSHNEGMSIALLEALACGLPVVVTETGGTEELVRDGINGHVVPWSDVAALTEALISLQTQRELRCRMGAANRTVAEQFTVQKATERYVELCRRVASK
jgi:glycosyltransferase involved in cell wall biosynthesis